VRPLVVRQAKFGAFEPTFGDAAAFGAGPVAGSRMPMPVIGPVIAVGTAVPADTFVAMGAAGVAEFVPALLLSAKTRIRPSTTTLPTTKASITSGCRLAPERSTGWPRSAD
jgi:hypothetical protein